MSCCLTHPQNHCPLVTATAPPCLFNNKLTSSRRVGSAGLRAVVGGSDGSCRARASEEEVGATTGSAWDTSCCCADNDAASPSPTPRPAAVARRPAYPSVLAIISCGLVPSSSKQLCSALVALKEGLRNNKKHGRWRGWGPIFRSWIFWIPQASTKAVVDASPLGSLPSRLGTDPSFSLESAEVFFFAPTEERKSLEALRVQNTPHRSCLHGREATLHHINGLLAPTGTTGTSVWRRNCRYTMHGMASTAIHAAWSCALSVRYTHTRDYQLTACRSLWD